VDIVCRSAPIPGDTTATDTLSAALADRYQIDRLMGEGGMATVYLARDLRHNRRVALKVLRPDLGAVVGVERFLAEIEVTANLQHPNLLALFDSGAAGELLYYVMPFVQGESLRARLDREKAAQLRTTRHHARADRFDRDRDAAIVRDGAEQ
jgi:serine/threonine protein kinase